MGLKVTELGEKLPKRVVEFCMKFLAQYEELMEHRKLIVYQTQGGSQSTKLQSQATAT